MTNLVNIARDALWIPDLLNTAEIPWSTDGASLYNSSGVVYDDVGGVKSNGNSAVSIAQQSIAVNMKPPQEDPVPYRVKIYCPNATSLYAVIAYAPSTITGTDDVMVHANFFQIPGYFDEIVMIHGHPSAHSFRDRPIVFGVSAFGNGHNNVTISVQNLGRTPPQYAAGVG